jgi:hypothetical protein
MRAVSRAERALLTVPGVPRKAEPSGADAAMSIGRIEQLTQHAFKVGYNIAPAPEGISSPKSGDPCRNCRQRPGTLLWVASGGAFAMAHGAGVYWCRVCVVTAQLEHARSMAASIPNLEAQLQEALDTPPDA